MSCPTRPPRGKRRLDRIVGIAADVRNDGLRNPIKPQVYVPIR